MSGAIIALLSAVLGAGAATAAVVAVISSSAPNDGAAVTNGPAQIVAPTEVIRYGG